MNKRHYEHTLPNIRGSLSNTYVYFYMIVYEWDSLSFQVSCADWIIGTGLYQVIGIPALSLTVLSETFDVIFLQFQFSSVLLQEVCCLFYGRENRLWLE